MGKEDNLRKENYGIPIGTIEKSGSTGRFSNGPYKVEYQFVESSGNDRIRLKRGDVVKCSSQIQIKHARNQFAVVLDRYRLIKHKFCIFKDYAAVVMIITGPTKGKVVKVAGHLLSHLTRDIDI